MTDSQEQLDQTEVKILMLINKLLRAYLGDPDSAEFRILSDKEKVAIFCRELQSVDLKFISYIASKSEQGK